MSKKQPRAKAQASTPAEAIPGVKPLTLTPQIAVGITGTFPDQQLFVEQPNQSPTRKKIQLTPANAYNILMGILMEKAGGIELERQLQLEAQAKSRSRKRAQPNWELIARHPEAVIIQRLATRSPELKSNVATKSLEEMDL